MTSIFLDIGFTFVGGPALSPGRKIVEILGLDRSALPLVSDIVFCGEHYSAESLMAAVEQGTGRTFAGEQRREVRSLWEHQFTDAFPLDGARELMGWLCRSPHDLHIVSNIWHPFFHAFQTLFPESADRIETVTASYREGVRKPSPEIFLRALARAGADPARSLMVGDSWEKDIVPCVGLGMKCVWAQTRPSPERNESLDRPEFQGRVVAVKGPRDVPPAIEGICKSMEKGYVRGNFFPRAPCRL